GRDGAHFKLREGIELVQRNTAGHDAGPWRSGSALCRVLDADGSREAGGQDREVDVTRIDDVEIVAVHLRIAQIVAARVVEDVRVVAVAVGGGDAAAQTADAGRVGSAAGRAIGQDLRQGGIDDEELGVGRNLINGRRVHEQSDLMLDGDMPTGDVDIE